MNYIQEALVLHAGRQLAAWYSELRSLGEQRRLPSLSELGYVAGFSVLILMTRRA